MTMRKSLIIAAALMTAGATHQAMAATAAAPGGGAYVSFFGGWAGSSSSNAHQQGTDFFDPIAGGPEAIDATGSVKTGSTGFAGAQAGYEWSYGSSLLPAFEVESLHLFRNQQHATLNNPTARLAEHTFDDTFPTSTTVVLANAVVGFRTPYQNITPYVGGGIGGAYVSVNGANSAQVNPAEPGINHFNSDTDSSAFTFAAQLKAGVRLALGSNAFVFGEYRYLDIVAHDQGFGATMYSTHVPTSPWTVKYGNTSYNLATVGIGFHF